MVVAAHPAVVAVGADEFFMDYTEVS